MAEFLCMVTVFARRNSMIAVVFGAYSEYDGGSVRIDGKYHATRVVETIEDAEGAYDVVFDYRDLEQCDGCICRVEHLDAHEEDLFKYLLQEEEDKVF